MPPTPDKEVCLQVATDTTWKSWKKEVKTVEQKGKFTTLGSHPAPTTPTDQYQNMALAVNPSFFVTPCHFNYILNTLDFCFE